MLNWVLAATFAAALLIRSRAGAVDLASRSSAQLLTIVLLVGMVWLGIALIYEIFRRLTNAPLRHGAKKILVLLAVVSSSAEMMLNKHQLELRLVAQSQSRGDKLIEALLAYKQARQSFPANLEQLASSGFGFKQPALGGSYFDYRVEENGDASISFLSVHEAICTRTSANPDWKCPGHSLLSP